MARRPGQQVWRARFSAVSEASFRAAMASLVEPNEHEASAVDARQVLGPTISSSNPRRRRKAGFCPASLNIRRRPRVRAGIGCADVADCAPFFVAPTPQPRPPPPPSSTAARKGVGAASTAAVSAVAVRTVAVSAVALRAAAVRAARRHATTPSRRRAGTRRHPPPPTATRRATGARPSRGRRIHPLPEPLLPRALPAPRVEDALLRCVLAPRALHGTALAPQVLHCAARIGVVWHCAARRCVARHCADAARRGTARRGAAHSTARGVEAARRGGDCTVAGCPLFSLSE
eukprot:619311-Prymnesium_polylepis.1